MKGTLRSNPVLIGVVTALSVVVAFMIAYNANQGLPFVPTYDVKVEVPDAAGLVPNNEVKVAGLRVGIVSGIEKVAHEDGSYTALLTLKLDLAAKPVYKDATYTVLLSSPLGLKYLSLDPGSSEAGVLPEGGTLGPKHAREPVQLQNYFNVFDERTRQSIRQDLKGWGSALAGRGQDLNDAIQSLGPLLRNLEPVARTLADPETDLAGFVSALERTSAAVAPVATSFADLFANIDTTFAALASVSGRLQLAIERSPLSFSRSTVALNRLRPFLRRATDLARDFRPSFATIREIAPDLADTAEAGARELPRLPVFNSRVVETLGTLERFVDYEPVPLVVDKLAQTFEAARPFLAFVTPAQTTCNYAALLFRNAASVFSQGTTTSGFRSWARAQILLPDLGPNSMGLPSQSVASGPEADNYLHTNPYPNTASPGQPKECEAGREPYTAGKVTIGNPAGNQGVVTEKVEGASGDEGGE